MSVKITRDEEKRLSGKAFMWPNVEMKESDRGG